MAKRVLFILRQTPGIAAREALDTALVAGVFDQRVSMLFRDDGVRQLLDAVSGEETEAQALADAIRSLPDYGIENLFVCTESLQRADLAVDQLIVPAEPLSLTRQQALISSQDMVLND